MEESESSTDPRDVFVVHGRNLVARNALFAFLEALDLRPLEWQEIMDRTGSGSPYIGHALDRAFQTAQAVVVLLTPDDEARLRGPYLEEHDPSYERELTGQARPNVLFESGMALAHNEERTILVQLGDVRPFSDIAGRHVLHLSDTPQSRNELAGRLRTAGCSANTTGNRWLEAGDFQAALAETSSASQDKSGEVIIGKKIQIPHQLSKRIRPVERLSRRFQVCRFQKMRWISLPRHTTTGKEDTLANVALVAFCTCQP